MIDTMNEEDENLSSTHWRGRKKYKSITNFVGQQISPVKYGGKNSVMKPYVGFGPSWL